MQTSVFQAVKEELSCGRIKQEEIFIMSCDVGPSVKTDLVRSLIGEFNSEDKNGGYLALPMAENLEFGISEGLINEGFFPIIGIYEAFLKICLEEISSICRSIDKNRSGMLIVATHSGFTCRDGRGIQSVDVPLIFNHHPIVNYWEPVSLDDAAAITRFVLRDRTGVNIIRCPRGEYCIQSGYVLQNMDEGYEWVNQIPSASHKNTNDNVYNILVFCNNVLISELEETRKILESDGLLMGLIAVRSSRRLLKYGESLLPVLLRTKLIVICHDSWAGGIRQSIEGLLLKTQENRPKLLIIEPSSYGRGGTFSELIEHNGLDHRSIVKSIRKEL